VFYLFANSETNPVKVPNLDIMDDDKVTLIIFIIFLGAMALLYSWEDL
jgi:hypothetical protein